MVKNAPLVSAEELDALIKGWGSAVVSTDKYFPVRFWIITAVVLFYLYITLFASETIATKMSSDPVELARLKTYLYFRGWFLLGTFCIATYAYAKGKYAGLMFGVIFLLGISNLVSDVFNVYWEKLTQPSTALTLVLMARVFVLWLVYICMRNASRLPEPGDRFNILLPLRRNPSN